MDLLETNRPLFIALGISLVLHAAFFAFVDVNFTTIPYEPEILNLRLVKPVGPLPTPQEVDGIDDPATYQQEPDLNQQPFPQQEDSVEPPLELGDQVHPQLSNEFGPESMPELPTSLPGMPEPEVQEQVNPFAQFTPDQLAQSVAEFATQSTGEGDEEKQIRRITDEGTASIEETFYLRSWLRKVRRIGQLNYPQEAIDQKLYGKLSLYVSIDPDGSLVETRVLESSGHEILDNAAVNIVKLSAPFAPFPASMRNNTDLLEIVRKWEFRKSSYSTDESDETQ